MAKHSHSGVHHLRGACVLIVDDDEDAADLYGIWLRDAGHRVSIVSDATRALILAPLLRPAVVVIDIRLPHVDGIQLVGQLRKLPELASCGYVAFSSYADARLPARCRAAGFADFLESPMVRSTLVKSVYAAAGLAQALQLRAIAQTSAAVALLRALTNPLRPPRRGRETHGPNAPVR